MERNPHDDALPQMQHQMHPNAIWTACAHLDGPSATRG